MLQALNVRLQFYALSRRDLHWVHFSHKLIVSVLLLFLHHQHLMFFSLFIFDFVILFKNLIDERGMLNLQSLLRSILFQTIILVLVVIANTFNIFKVIISFDLVMTCSASPLNEIIGWRLSHNGFVIITASY